MSKLFSIFLFLVALSSLAFSQQTNQCDNKEIRIIKDKPTVYITFERFGKAVNLSEKRMVEPNDNSKSRDKGKDIWLRIHNNTCWNLKFMQYGMYIPKQIGNESFGERFKRMGILNDGAEIGLFYTVVKANKQSFYVGIDSFDYVTLLPGNSVLFSVESEHLSKDQSVQVRYEYDWEFQKGFTINEPTHKVMFRSYDLEEQPDK